MGAPGTSAPNRAVRVGAAMIGLGVVQFSVAMAVVQAGYPGYSDLTNYISDLGNTATSPWHDGFNVSIVLLGLLAFAGVLLAGPGFPGRRTRSVGLSLVLLASVGAVLVGFFPENVDLAVHELASLLVFAPGGVALVVLAVGMRPGTGWGWLRWPSVALGSVTLVSLAYYLPSQAVSATWYPGLVERLIVFPILVWGFVVAVHLLRDPATPARAPLPVPA